MYTSCVLVVCPFFRHYKYMFCFPVIKIDLMFTIKSKKDLNRNLGQQTDDVVRCVVVFQCISHIITIL